MLRSGGIQSVMTFHLAPSHSMNLTAPPPSWSAHELRKYGPIELVPAIHGLHYGSSCFEGFKAYRWADGSVNVFRMDRHIERMRQSARALVMPEPDGAQLAQMEGAAGAGQPEPAQHLPRPRLLANGALAQGDSDLAAHGCPPSMTAAGVASALPSAGNFSGDVDSSASELSLPGVLNSTSNSE